MGQIALIVVAAAWAAVLLPPLLRSRAENRPNSSVSDFRNQLSSLQRVMPTRSVSVRSMGRSLAPSTLGRPAAPGRPAGRAAKPSPRGQNSYGPARQGGAGRAEQQRMHEASLRTRTHGNRDATAAARRPAGAMTPAMIAKRRRTNVLFVLVLTTASGGFLAATTGSDAMVLLFAAGMIGLGGYVYLLVTLNQREAGAPSPAALARQARAQRYAAAPRRPAPRDPLVRDWTPAGGYEYGDLDDGSYDSLYEPGPAERRAANRDGDYNYVPAPPRAVPGSGQSGRISYGRPAAVRRAAASPDPYAAPMPRDPRDPFGREQQGREITRGTPVRNGRHATGQHPVQQRQQPSPRSRTGSSTR
jgi:hypothetical protein